MNWRDLIEEYCKITDFDRIDTLERLLDCLVANNKVTPEDVAHFLFPDAKGYFS